MNEPKLNLADLIEDFTGPQWEDYPDLPGFRVLLRLPDAPQMTACLGQSAGAGDETGIIAAFNFETLKYALADWQGLTVAGLRKLLVNGRLKADLPAETAVPFSPETRDLLLRLAPAFYGWMIGSCRDRLQREEDDGKNSLTTSSTSPTPSPAPARAAKRKGKSSA